MYSVKNERDRIISLKNTANITQIGTKRGSKGKEHSDVLNGSPIKRKLERKKEERALKQAKNRENQPVETKQRLREEGKLRKI